MPIQPSEFRAMSDNVLMEWHRLTILLDQARREKACAEHDLNQLRGIVTILKMELGAVINTARQLAAFVVMVGFDNVPDRFVAGLKAALTEAAEVNDSAAKCLS